GVGAVRGRVVAADAEVQLAADPAAGRGRAQGVAFQAGADGGRRVRRAGAGRKDHHEQQREAGRTVVHGGLRDQGAAKRGRAHGAAEITGRHVLIPTAPPSACRPPLSYRAIRIAITTLIEAICMHAPTRSRLTLALALAITLPVGAAAQATGADTTTLDQVIVTGTRASDRTVLESTSPVDVLTAAELRRAAGPAGELGSALQALLPSFNFPRQSNSGGADHVRAAQLRGLSPDQVLVLVNGRRRHTSALVSTGSKIGRGTTPVDFNAIPVGAVARIEVLRDG